MKICVVTGSRAEFGLLKPLLDEMKKDDKFDLKLIVTGMHLSHEFGETFREIEESGFQIYCKIEMLLSSDTQVGILKSMGIELISIAEALSEMSPDLIVLLGDRFEIFIAATAAYVLNIPIAHIHGGETTQGAYDEGFRHSITKMSHLHFTSTEDYRKRVIQLGENPELVFNVGALGLDNIYQVDLLSLEELSDSLNFSLKEPFFVITYHPVTLEDKDSKYDINQLFKSLKNFRQYKWLFTKPNADHGGRIISELIDEFVFNHKANALAIDSLGYVRYLSSLRYAELVIGNSSSGIIEMPSFNKPSINIGNRQKGRLIPKSVINAEPNQQSITKAISKGLDIKFRSSLLDFKNPYGDGLAAGRIINTLGNISSSDFTQKEFYDLKFTK